VSRLSGGMRMRATGARGPSAGVRPFVPRTPIGSTPGIIVVPVNQHAASFDSLAGCYVVVTGCHGGGLDIPLREAASNDLISIGGAGGLQSATGIGVVGRVSGGGRSVTDGAGIASVRVTVAAGGALGGCIEIAVPIGRLGLLVSPFGASTVGRSEADARSRVLEALTKADDAAATAAGRKALGAVLAGWPNSRHFDSDRIGGRRAIL